MTTAETGKNILIPVENAFSTLAEVNPTVCIEMLCPYHGEK
jgi:hypothetical protein